MAFKFKPNTLYQMPAHFGPWPIEKVVHYSDATILSMQYLTDKDALAALLPEPFQPADEPVVMVYCNMFKGIDFLAGRGYNAVGVDLSAVFDGKKDHFEGRYAAVLWESDFYPVFGGREGQGAPKLYADIPDPSQEGNSWRFHCSEYGTRLIEGEIKNLTAVDDSTVRMMEEMASGTPWMGWKYIPRTDLSGSDVSYPTVIPATAHLSQAWLGEGSHRFFETTWESTPLSAHIMKGLQTLVVKEYRMAVVLKGNMDLPIAETRMLE